MTNEIKNTIEDSNAIPKSLEELVIELAVSLMGVSVSNADTVTDYALAQIREFFGVDHVFLRRHDHEQGYSIMVSEKPARVDIPDPDPLAVVPFDSDPVFAATQHLVKPLIVYPKEHGDYDQLVEEAAGESATFAGVPLRCGDDTIGLMGLIRYGLRPWNDDEIRSLRVIATLFAQLWGRIDAEKEVARLAYFDSLTNLPNRRKLTDHINDLDPDTLMSLLLVDVDNMKVINSGLDYAAGNAFLCELAKRLLACVSDKAIVARLQGDQFGVLIVDEPMHVVEQLARLLIKTLSVPVKFNHLSLGRSVSIGIASNTISTDHHFSDADVSLYQAEGTLRSSLIFAEANAALQQAKQQGKKKAVTFDENMRSRILDRFQVELALRQAIDEDELILHFQPEVNLNSGNIVAVEALLRWDHPQKGVLSAGVFIESAEESGLIVEIGDIVLRKAIKQLSVWHLIDPKLEMWINISPAQLVSRDLATQLEWLLLKYKVPPKNVCLELTEHSVLVDVESSRLILERLRKLGVKLALDDFGTGYSSMTQLKTLPITSLKIDMSFVAGLGVSKYDTAIIDATITLANAFGLDVVAEGIEEVSQLIELKERGCNKGQGYYLARPAAPDDIQQMLGKTLDVELSHRDAPQQLVLTEEFVENQV